MKAQLHDTRNNQFLRRFFDTLYEITPDKFVDFYMRIPKSVKRMLLSMSVSLVLILIVFQLAKVGVDAVEWANRTPLNERIIAPYNVEGRTQPNIDITLVEGRELPMVDGAALEQERVEAVEAVRAEALIAAEEAFNAAMAKFEVTAASAGAVEDAPPADNAPVAEGAEAVPVVEPIAPTLEDFMPEIDTQAIRAEIQPEIDNSYFLVMPNFLDYNRTYIYDNIQAHPTMNCILTAGDVEALPCGLQRAPVFVEAADYMSADNALVRVMAVKYETAEIAQDSMKSLQRHSNRIGHLGNYAITDIRPVNYFFAVANGWRVFTWSNGEWVYSVSAKSLERVESIVLGFSY